MTGGSTAGDTYSGILGALVYAFRATGSRLCRAYVIVSVLVAALVGLVFGLAVVRLIGTSAGATGGFLTSARAFYVVIALCFVGPLLAPTVLVARRHRHARGDARYDRAMAAAGFLFIGSLYLGLVASMPPTFELDGDTVSRPAADGVFGPAIECLYAIPEPAWPVVPAAAAAIMVLVHRHYA